MAKMVKITCLFLAVISVWFSLSFRSGKITFKVGQWERPLIMSEASTDDDGDSGETDFA